MTEQEYRIELHNHNNFHQKQKDVAKKLGDRIIERYYEDDNSDFDNIVREEVRKITSEINESQAMGKPNKPGYHKANND